jgi:quercetin dioxygenase-like cupin family protein
MARQFSCWCALLLLGVSACGRSPVAQRAARPAILQSADGEHRILRGRKPILLKIDPATVGSQHLFLGTEVMPPGDSIPVHRHSQEEEAVFIHRGTLDVQLADQHARAESGATVFIPARTWIGFRNPGPDTAEIVYVFNEPAFARCLRAFSVAPGRPYREPGPDSVRAIREVCHQEVPSR